jgi:ubiquinone/menaquinone biosynthesis C-methylase UbiE
MSEKQKTVVNYFSRGMDAERYARSRPYIHSTAISKFRTFADIDKPFPRALDVGCGTGQSTVALSEIATSVIGIDSSSDMLSNAIPHQKIEYRQSTAEAIPFEDEKFDLITAGQAFHWFDHDAFLSESHRLLRVPGWLVIYTSWFTGNIKEDSKFFDWFKGEYLKRYPSPPRTRNHITRELAEKHSFTFHGEEEFTNEIKMSSNRFKDYQLSTSNVIAVVEKGNVGFDDVKDWLHNSLAPFYDSQHERTFIFYGKIWYLEKTAG